MDQGNAHSPWAAHSSKIWALIAAVVTYFFGALGGITAGISAALAGAVFWWWLIERPLKPTYSQGVIFGFLTQLAAYPLTYLLSGFLGLPDPLSGDLPAFTYSGLLPSLAELSEILSGMVAWHAFALIATIITIPLGVLDGLVLVALRRRFLDDPENHSTEAERSLRTRFTDNPIGAIGGLVVLLFAGAILAVPGAGSADIVVDLFVELFPVVVIGLVILAYSLILGRSR